MRMAYGHHLAKTADTYCRFQFLTDIRFIFSLISGYLRTIVMQIIFLNSIFLPINSVTVIFNSNISFIFLLFFHLHL